MIETSDVDVSLWKNDPSAHPAPPESGTFSGATDFLDKPHQGQMELNVGDSYEFTTRMGGERPITIKFQQKTIDNEGRKEWRTITSFQLRNRQLGFTLKVHLKNRHVGSLKLRYFSSNSEPGAVICKEKLIVNHRCACS